jgi:hypothetical protein
LANRYTGQSKNGQNNALQPHHRQKSKRTFNHIYWVHKALKQPEFELRQCCLVSHLLIDKTKPVAIVESEKTAVIASVYLPQFIWVAVGSLTNLNAEKCSILKGRTVTLFPDLNGFDKWSSKAKELSHLAIFTVSDLLERKATEAERKQGFDLADYLIKFRLQRRLHRPEPEATEPPPAVQPLVEVKPFEQPNPFTISVSPNNQSPKAGNRILPTLKTTLQELILPKEPILLSPGVTIFKVDTFMQSHLDTLKANEGNKYFLPHLNRLQDLKSIIDKLS